LLPKQAGFFTPIPEVCVQLKDNVSTTFAALILTMAVLVILVMFDAGVVAGIANSIAYAWRVLT
jgi:hypothetical protein